LQRTHPGAQKTRRTPGNWWGKTSKYHPGCHMFWLCWESVPPFGTIWKDEHPTASSLERLAIWPKLLFMKINNHLISIWPYLLDPFGLDHMLPNLSESLCRPPWAWISDSVEVTWGSNSFTKPWFSIRTIHFGGPYWG
jgi:hypothetical protein